MFHWSKQSSCMIFENLNYNILQIWFAAEMLKKKEEEYMAQQAEKRKKREEIIKMAGKLIYL